MTTKKAMTQGTTEAWEAGQLGLSEDHVAVASTELTAEIDEALGLQAISIRLPRKTIQAYKHIAELHGRGYQPLMRDAIVRWANDELKQLLAGTIESQRKRPKHAPKASTFTPKPPSTPLKKAA